MTSGNRLRIGIHSDLRERGDQAAIYRETLELFTRAEQLGFDSAWVRSYHFRRTSGTPVSASRADCRRPSRSSARSPGARRGYGSGPRDARPHSRRDQINGTDQELNPPAPGLSARIWESALTERTGHDSARRGNGVLIGTTQTVPAEVTAAAYYASLPAGVAPRVGLVIHIHPARDRRTALAELEDDVETVYAWGKDWLPAAETLQERAAAINVRYGTPAEITESIRVFPAFPFTTELQFSVAYGTPSRRSASTRSKPSSPRSRRGWDGRRDGKRC